MTLQLARVHYAELNSRQKENFNFQKVSAMLADYGFVTLRLSDDWQGADFIAQHIDGKLFLKVQLKGRLLFDKKYCGKELYIAFFTNDEWYLYSHDELLEKVEPSIRHTPSWSVHGCYHYPYLTQVLRPILAPYKLTGS